MIIGEDIGEGRGMLNRCGGNKQQTLFDIYMNIMCNSNKSTQKNINQKTYNKQ